MNAITSKRKVEQAAAPSAAGILAQIEAKKSEVKRLAQRQYDLAPKTVGDPAAEREYFQIMEDTVAAERAIERLQVALSNIQNQAAVAATTERTQLRRGQLAEFQAVLNRRLAAVADLAAAIEAASRAYAIFMGETEKLTGLLPTGCSLPAVPVLANFEFTVNGAAFPVGPAAAIAAEMHRTAEAPQLRLPGAKALTLLSDAPQSIDPMVTALRRTNDWILGSVREQLDRAEAGAVKALAS